MKIFIKTLTGRTVVIEASSEDKVIDMKQRIEEKESIPISQQRLFFKGKLLNDDETLLEYNINEKSTLDLVLRLRVIT